MAKHVEELETLREALGLQRLNIISHSAGTLLAYEYLRAHADRVKNLTMVGALPHKNGRAYFDAEYATLWKTLGDDKKRFEERDAVMDELRKAGLNNASKSPKQEAHLALIRQVGAETFRVEQWRSALPMRVNPDAARRTRATTTFEVTNKTQLYRLLARFERSTRVRADYGFLSELGRPESHA